MNPPRRRAEVTGRFVQFFSRDTKIATVRWHSRFKCEYRTRRDAMAAKAAWEERGKILWPEDIKPEKAAAKQPQPMRRRESPSQVETRL
jgi:hypothetical protein